MLIAIGKCSLCGLDVVRDTSCIVEDECVGCGGIRKNYCVEMFLPSPTAKRNVYNEIEADFLERRDGIIKYDDVYSVANH